MAFKVYKPNKSAAGSLISINFSAKADKPNQKGDKSFYFTIKKQTTWDEKTRVGGFRGGDSTTVKMTPLEIAGILYAIKKDVSLANAIGQEYVYHDSPEFATVITFEPHFKMVKNESGKWVNGSERKGFGLRFMKKNKANEGDKKTFSIGLSFAETELLSNFLQDGLGHIFNAWYSEEISDYKERAAQKAKQDNIPRKETERQEDVPFSNEEPPPDVEF